MNITKITGSVLRRIVSNLMAVGVFSVVAVCAQAPPKIALVDLQKVFTNYFKTKQADALLQDTGADAQKTMDGMMQEYKKYSEEFNKLNEAANDQAVSAEERDKRQKSAKAKLTEIQEVEKNLTQFRNQARVNLDEQKKRYREKILGDMLDKVNAKANALGYSLVLDSSGETFNNGTRLVLFAKGLPDLTDELISELNATAPPGFLNSATNKEEKPVVTPPKTEDEKPSTAPSKAPKKK